MDKLDPVFVDFLNYCPRAFEEMKQEKGLREMAEKAASHGLYLDYKSDFENTFQKKVLEHFKGNSQFLNAYEDEKQRHAFTQKFDDYSFRFLHYVESLKYGLGVGMPTPQSAGAF